VIGTYLRRGLAAGLLAGLLAGLFAFVFGEPFLERAIELEESAHAGEHAHGEAVFDRGEQKAGLILATAIYGTGVGGLFGLVYAYLRTRSFLGGERVRSLSLSGAAFLGAVLLPFLKYPPNPPGVGVDPDSLGVRTLAYLTMVGLSLLALFVAWRVAREMEDGYPRARRLASAGVVAGFWLLLYLALPDFPAADAGEVPGSLLWGFRLSSLGTQAVLWAGIGTFFGLLCHRAERREAL
jgi:predicted cobalt transporter CbtA